MKLTAVLLGTVLIWSACAHADEQTEGAHGSLKGTAINVADIAVSARFYTQVFGLKICRQVPDGPVSKAIEVVLSTTGTFDLKDTPLLVLFHLPKQPLPMGRTAFGRIVLLTTNADDVVSRVKAAGYSATRSSTEPGVTTVIDPDGYHIELIQPPS